MMHDVKVPFFMLEFSGRKIMNHHFHVDNDKGDSVICYDMIIDRDLTVQLGLTAKFKASSPSMGWRYSAYERTQRSTSEIQSKSA